MPRPKGSKNKPIGVATVLETLPIITLDVKDNEHSLVQKIRGAYRKLGIYGKSTMIAKTIWNCGSFESKNFQLAIKAAKTIVKIEGVA